MPEHLLDIEQTFGRLLGKEIPLFEHVQPSIITILKAYGENNLSNLLGYLFKGEDHPLLKRIFLNALLDCFDFDPEIPQDDDIDNYLSEIKVHLEYETQFGRIDILIRRDHHQPSKRWAVIIENKIHHTLNNDLDDYFYTTGQRFEILPKQMAVVVLALRNTSAGLQSHIPSQIILHSTLKANVHKSYQDNFHQFNDRSSTLILTEYLRHIDDMYLVSSNYANDASVDFFTQHRLLINRLCRERWNWTFDSLASRNKKYLFEHLHRADKVVALQEHVLKGMDRAFDHYLGLTGRSVGGNSTVRYFRGNGSSFDLIRYQLDYKGYYSGEKSQLEFKSWLHTSVLKKMHIDTLESGIEYALGIVNGQYQGLSGDWELVHTSQYTPDHANIAKVIKENLSNNWLTLEDVLSKAFEERQLRDRYVLLRQLLSDAHYQCEDHGTGFVFKDDILDFFLRYKVNFVAPDYTEITLYVNINQWPACWQVLRKSSKAKLFTQFNDHQSWHLPEIRDEDSHDSVMNFDAMAKRSYREPDEEKAVERFKEELNLFKLLEVELQYQYKL